MLEKLNQFLCWIGWHENSVSSTFANLSTNDPDFAVAERKFCQHCGKVKEKTFSANDW